MRKTFLDELVGVLDAITFPGYSDVIYETRVFLSHLPGVFLVEDEILPLGVAIKGVAIICQLEKYEKLSQQDKEKKKIYFEFIVNEDDSPKEATAIQLDRFHYIDNWSTIIETIIDRLSPGDKLMSLGFRETNFFSLN